MTNTNTVKITEEHPKVLHPTRIQEQQYAYNTFYVVPPYGTSLLDMEKPAYWSHVAQKLRVCDRIEVDAEDGSFYAKFKVTYCDKAAANVALIEFKEINRSSSEKQESVKDQFAIKFNGPHAKWGVIRKSDKVLLQSELETKELADTWLNEYVKALKA